MSKSESNGSVRIDKWLWAARFFKTRSLAKTAIEKGRVKHDNQRVKPSRDMKVGDVLQIRQGFDDKTIEIIALSDQRRGASEAQMLYRETPASIELRTKQAQLRKAQNAGLDPLSERPNKKQRRQIHQFKNIYQLEED